MHGPDTTNKPWAGRAALGVVLAVALAVRLVPWPQVFTAGGVALMADGDTYYHALRAERLARDWPHVPWTDPGMNFPLGAAIPWPPLLDQVVATQHDLHAFLGEDLRLQQAQLSRRGI